VPAMAPHVRARARVGARVGARARARARTRALRRACDDAVCHGALGALEVDLAHLALARGVVCDDALGSGVGAQHVCALE